MQGLLPRPLAARVYLLNARVALDEGDFGEYNSCATFLVGLLRRGGFDLEGAYPGVVGVGELDELLGYSIAYKALTDPSTLPETLRDVQTVKETQPPQTPPFPWPSCAAALSLALPFSSSAALPLPPPYATPADLPRLLPCFADALLPKLRPAAFEAVLRAYAVVPLPRLAGLLAFSGGGGGDDDPVFDAETYVEEERGGVIVKRGGEWVLDCRETLERRRRGDKL